MLSKVHDLIHTMKAFQNKLEEIERTLQRFTVKMLDLCQGKMQVMEETVSKWCIRNQDK